MTKKKSDFSKYYQTCVRFSEKEYEKIKKQARLIGITIPQLLKDGWKNVALEEPKFSNEESRKWLKELGYIGNNINQIARWVNSGSYYGDLSELKNWRLELAKLMGQIK